MPSAGRALVALRPAQAVVRGSGSKMKSNAWRWLWGLIPVAMLGWVALLSERERIETDLRTRAQAALKGAGLPWAATSFVGRDAVLTGQALEEGQPASAATLVDNLYGVRVVDNRSDLIEKVDRYDWSASERDNKLRLTGHVPNEDVRKDILGLAKAAFPKAQVEDRMKLARGAPPRDTYVGGIGFALKQLPQLKNATAELDGTDLSIAGNANDQAAYKGVKGALASQLPRGVRLKSDRVTPPVINPYTWSARLENNQVLLAGHVPSEAARKSLFDEAKAAFPRAAVVDRMELGEGAPNDFAGAASASVRELARLEDGAAEMRGNQVNIVGMATNDAIADAAKKGVRERTPPSFRVTEAIKSRGPVIPTINPYRTAIEATPQAVVLTGHAPSEAAKTAIAESVRARLPGRRIDNRLEIGNGAAPGWQSCMQYGVAGLGRLGGGIAALTGRKLDVTGETTDESLKQGLPGELELAAGNTCDVETEIALRDDGRKAAEAAAAVAAAEARKRAEDEAKRRSEDDARKRQEMAALDARRKAEDEARRKAEDDAKRRAEAARCQDNLTRLVKAGIILFERASAQLNNRSNATLDEIVVALKACPGVAIEIEGHTDAEGELDRNQKLSERRATSVREYLVEAGIEAGRLEAKGYGQAKPIAPNDTPEGRAKNRRIELTVKGK